ncbi:hypothetical protein EPN44_07110 [bacterium]|nr:MAG: hypothetical protein EPN44_07110 [bacterium]
MKVIAVLLAIVLFAIGIYYGFIAQADPHGTFLGLHRGKHAVLFFGLAILAVIWARFQSATES